MADSALPTPESLDIQAVRPLPTAQTPAFADTALTAGAVAIAAKLSDEGFQALFAGGCVRDLLLGQESHDIDIATDATPDEIKRIFPRRGEARLVGASFGVVMVRSFGHWYEVATFREDGTYSDGRRPDNVTYSRDPAQDVLRRDFTAGGLYFDPATQTIVDHVGGRQDLAEGLIRAIGDPRARFEEDYLRILRGVRFAARFGWRLEETTATAMREKAPHLRDLAAERVLEELTRIWLGPNPDYALALLDALEVLPVVLPEVAALRGVPQPPDVHPEGDVLTHTRLMLRRMGRDSAAIRLGRESAPPGGIEATAALAWGTLLHDVGKPPTFAETDRIRFHGHAKVGAAAVLGIAERLRFSNDLRDRVSALVLRHMDFINIQSMRTSTLKRFLRQPHIEEHLALHRLDCLESHGQLSNWEFAQVKLRAFREEPPHTALKPEPLATGRDLIDMGFKPGPGFKRMLVMLEDAQLENEVTTREEALQFLRDAAESEGKGETHV